MVRITEELIRKRSEHNEGLISTLEELTLHQQDIDKIEYLDRWCRDLKILYFQSNLISKLENLSRLKKLEYLNIALNNIEKVENLEGCESLTKLDFTVNFIGELTSIESLRHLEHLREMFLTGNPCAEYEGYREYVIATLPRLHSLDGIEIEKSERIKATQVLHVIRPEILVQQDKYRRKREKEKQESSNEYNSPVTEQRLETDASDESSVTEEERTEEERRKSFWEEKVPYTPESRIQIHEHLQATRHKDDSKKERKTVTPKKLQRDDGRMMNVNEAKIDFSLTESDDRNSILLDLAVHKYLDTSLCDVDVQPTYVRAYIKGKVFQLVFDEEVQPSKSTAQRSQITGNLLITMPKVKQVLKPDVTNKPKQSALSKEKSAERSGNQLLEVDPTSAKCVDLAGIVADRSGGDVTGCILTSTSSWQSTIKERPNSPGFVDDAEVPGLM